MRPQSQVVCFLLQEVAPGATSISALATSLGAARIAVGSYRGTGECKNNNGSNYKRTLTLNFAPQMIIFWDKQSHNNQNAGREMSPVFGRISGDYVRSSSWSEQFGIFTPISNDSTSSCKYYWTVGSHDFNITFSGTTVTFSGLYADNMYNSSSKTYGYLAIG